ncbi:F-box domain-containing protein [Pyrenochaeta sp. DS3sAY3a]|nr:F-box domain-containing protein [Pyrenochaeta sp. DS3sAY3a]
MLFEFLATELVLQVFFSCNSVTDVTALSSTCRRFRNIYSSSQKLAVLETVAETQFGPLEDLTQLLTHNSSQPAHIIRSVPFSAALLKQIVHHGRVAAKWCAIYPFKKWKYNYESRRLLTSEECYRLRRAIYRSWLYTRAYHNRDHPRELRATKLVLQKRAALLHNWNAWELAEIADVHNVIREVVHSNICPSNGTIARKFRKRHPDNEHGLLFNIHLNYPPPVQTSYNPFTTNSLSMHFNNTSTYTSRYTSSKYSLHASHEIGSEGWGDDIPHYYVVEDMLKMDPEQILWLKENAPFKGMVEGYVRTLGESYDGSNWFTNNGETWVQTLEFVLNERGEELACFMGCIGEGAMGVAVVEEGR